MSDAWSHMSSSNLSAIPQGSGATVSTGGTALSCESASPGPPRRSGDARSGGTYAPVDAAADTD